MATCPVIRGIEEDGTISESISFESLIKSIESDDPDVRELMHDLPSIIALMRQVHKHAWWNGAEFGRLVFVKIDEDEQIKRDS